MLDLLHICDKQRIHLFWRQLDPDDGKLLGMYFLSPGGRPVIVLDESLMHRTRLARCVLAEEISHHLTTPTANHVVQGVDALNTQAIWRDESRSVRMAADYLIPTERLGLAVKRGISSPHELAEYFHVEEWMVQRKFHVLRQDLREQQKLRVSIGDILSPLLVETLWGQAV